MRYIFSTGSLHTCGIDRCFALAADAGFGGVELMYAIAQVGARRLFAPIPGWDTER